MTAHRFHIFGGDNPRIVFSLPGYNAKDPALPDAYKSLDTAWPGGANYRDAREASLSASGNDVTASAPAGTLSDYADPVLFYWDRPAGKAITGVTWTGQGWNIVKFYQTVDHLRGYRFAEQEYRNNGSFITPTAEPNVSGLRAFYSTLTGNTLAAPLAPQRGLWRWRIGSHPTRAPGFYISQQNADVFTCPDDHLVASISTGAVQVRAGGRVTANRYTLDVAVAAQNGVVTGTYAQYGFYVYVDLPQEYPDLPPVYVRSWLDDSIAPGQEAQAYWITPSRLLLRCAKRPTVGVSALRPAWESWHNTPVFTTLDYFIFSPFTPRTAAQSTVPTMRWKLDIEGPSKISKINTDVMTCPDSDLLFNTDWRCLRELARGEITRQITGSTNYSYIPIAIPDVEQVNRPLAIISLQAKYLLTTNMHTETRYSTALDYTNVNNISARFMPPDKFYISVAPSSGTTIHTVKLNYIIYDAG